MSVLRYLQKMQLLDRMIRRKATGNQKEFARKAGMSRGLLNIYLNEMKELGFPINYCRRRSSYYYEEEGRMVESLFEKAITKEEMSRHTGGENMFQPCLYIFNDTDYWQYTSGSDWE
jgi:hypothetical protein